MFGSSPFPWWSTAGPGVELYGGPPSSGVSSDPPPTVAIPPKPRTVTTAAPITKPTCPLPQLPPGGIWEVADDSGGWYYHAGGRTYFILEERGRCTILHSYVPGGGRPPAGPDQRSPGGVCGPVAGLPVGGKWKYTGDYTWSYTMPDGRVYVISRTTNTNGTRVCRIIYSTPPGPRGGIRGIVGGVTGYLGILSTILQIISKPADPVAACHEALDYIRSSVRDCLEAIREARRIMAELRSSLAQIANSCPGMSAQCRRRLNDNFNWMAAAIKRMTEIEQETAQLATAARLALCLDNFYGNPREDALDNLATPERLQEMAANADRLCGQCHDALKTANLWSGELDSFRKACSCIQIEEAVQQGAPIKGVVERTGPKNT